MAVWLAPAAGYGVERVPPEGGGVVAANHFSGIDHPLIGGFCPRIIYFLAKAELLEEVPVIPCGLDTFGWSPRNRRKCAVVWGEPMRLDGLPRNRRGYAEAAQVVGAEIVRLWRLAAEASAAGLPPELPDGAKRSGINPKLEPARVAH